MFSRVLIHKFESSIGFGLKPMLTQILAYQFVITSPPQPQFAAFKIETMMMTFQDCFRN